MDFISIINPVTGQPEPWIGASARLTLRDIATGNVMGQSSATGYIGSITAGTQTKTFNFELAFGHGAPGLSVNFDLEALHLNVWTEPPLLSNEISDTGTLTIH